MKFKIALVCCLFLHSLLFSNSFSFLENESSTWFAKDYPPNTYYNGESDSRFNVIKFNKLGNSILERNYMLYKQRNLYEINRYSSYSFSIIDYDKDFDLYLNLNFSWGGLVFNIIMEESYLLGSTLYCTNSDGFYNPYSIKDIKDKSSYSLTFTNKEIKFSSVKPDVSDDFFKARAEDRLMSGTVVFYNTSTVSNFENYFNDDIIKKSLLDSFDTNSKSDYVELDVISKFFKTFAGSWVYEGKNTNKTISQCTAFSYDYIFLIFNFDLQSVGLFNHTYVTRHSYNLSDANSELYLDNFLSIKNVYTKSGKTNTRWHKAKPYILEGNQYTTVKPLCALYYDISKKQLMLAKADVLIEKTRDGVNKKYNTSQYFSNIKSFKGNPYEIIWQPLIPKRGEVKIPEINQKLKWIIKDNYIEEYIQDEDGNFLLNSTLKKES